MSKLDVGYKVRNVQDEQVPEERSRCGTIEILTASDVIQNGTHRTFVVFLKSICCDLILNVIVYPEMGPLGED